MPGLYQESEQKSGFPILANDPHIQFSSPSVWYEAHLKTPDFEIYGHHMAGIPIPPLGHTKDKAWGVTMFQNDDIFFYREKINPKDKNQVLYEGKWTDLEIRIEKIYIKGKKKPLLFTVRTSPHGPLMNDVVPEFAIINEPISMWWAFANPESDMLTAFYDLAREQDFKKIPNHLAKIHAPGLNIMYADKKQNIAWWAVAKIPDMPDAVNTQNFLDGSLPEHQIKKSVPFSQNPHMINPGQGFIASANNDPHTAVPAQRRIPGYYSNDQRFNRVVEMLQQKDKDWTLEDMQALQLDDLDKVHKKIVKVLSKYYNVNKGSDFSKKLIKSS